ncbi:MAG: SDR family NAD(P)-dependent oxidoreductase [Lachnospiraceae bacterium]|nr:SDR family NAD(P)-dependent oxidoreductase [Candidatus Colinaster equi]
MKEFDKNYTYLVTGAAGFIGFYLSKRIMEAGAKVIGYDNMNDYYEVSLKEHRLEQLKKVTTGEFTFIKGDLACKEQLTEVFDTYKPDVVVNLAAQAGVRYSIDNPDAYIQSNLVGFANILECCRHHDVKHLVYASSSSVYGGNTKIPFETTDQVDRPVSLYAATKKSNELMAYSYCKLYGMAATGLRFFTVYGPMGRPDMAAYKFAKKIMAGESIQIYNNGDMYRDFTYVEDIVTGIMNTLCNPPAPDDLGAKYKVYNIGNNKPEKLLDFVAALEKALGREAKKEFLPMQPGDVYRTYADVSELMKDFDFKPDTSIEDGLGRFAVWFREYYNIED